MINENILTPRKYHLKGYFCYPSPYIISKKAIKNIRYNRNVQNVNQFKWIHCYNRAKALA